MAKTQQKWPQILILEEKYSNRYYLIKSTVHLYKTALYIYIDRCTWCGYSIDNDVVKNNNGKKALEYLYHRSSYEYENFELVSPEAI